MTSTRVPEIDPLGECSTPVGLVRVIPGGPVEWLVTEARNRSFAADALEKELAETKAVLGDLLQEKLPVVYIVEESIESVDQPKNHGVYRDLEEAKAEAQKLFIAQDIGQVVGPWVFRETHTMGARDYWNLSMTRFYVTPYTVR